MNFAEKIVANGVITMLPDPNPYMQPCGKGTMLPSQISASKSFVEQLGIQHSHNTYLTLLNAPNVPTSA